MLLQRLAAALTTRRPWPPLHSPIYESVQEERADADDTDPGPAPSEPGGGGCAAMSRVDSGHETLADDDSPTPTFEDDVAEPQHIYEEVWTPAAPAPARLPNISGVLQHTGPVIRPVACRPTPTHTPSATPTRFGSVEHINRPAHYGSALNLNTSGPVSGGVERRPCSNMARARFESLDNLRSAGADVASYGPCSVMEEYRGLRGRPAEPRRESFSGRVEGTRRGEPPTSLAHCLARHDSLKSLTPSGGGGARIGGSVSNLAATERRETALPRAGSVNSERLAFAATAPGLGGSGHPARAAMVPCSSSLGSYTARASGDHSSASTPSPSDSGVAGLEAALRERDSEINYLRETMEQNEQVIFSVYQEKERNWEKELRKIKAIYDNRLKASQQRALKMEQMLTMQTYQLQQEKRKLRQDIDEARRDKEQCSRQNQQLKQELSSLRTQLEDTEWGLCQKTGEISLLKSQLKDCQGDQTTRSHEMLHIRAQVREYAAQLETKEVDNQRLHAETLSLREQAMDRRNDEANVVIGQLQREMERLRADLSLIRQQAQAQKESFEEERLHWLDEKQKVVNYQKQLQLNYMEMYKRNKSLELELQRSESKLNSSGESQC